MINNRRFFLLNIREFIVKNKNKAYVCSLTVKDLAVAFIRSEIDYVIVAYLPFGKCLFGKCPSP